LGNGNFGKFIDKVKEHFDFIVIDNSPALVVTDAVLVGKFADINLFVVRAEKTNKEQISMINHMQNLGTMKHLAIALNDVRKGRHGYHNYYGKGYGVYSDKKSTKKKDVLLEEVSNG
jgi:tyrosine-protein kinase Etk/Wzc